MSTRASHLENERALHAPFLRSRLGSLLAVLPLSVWTVVHVWENLTAFQGEAAWEATVTGYGHPASQVVTWAVVLLPLLVHTAWGARRMFASRPNLGRYKYFGNLKYVLQRLSAIGVLAFLCAHVWLAMIEPRFVKGHPERFADLAHEMRHHTPTLVVYLLGTLGVAYHLANGIQGFSMGWGLVSSRRGLARLEPVAIGVFLLLLGLSWAAIYALWNAGAAITTL